MGGGSSGCGDPCWVTCDNKPIRLKSHPRAAQPGGKEVSRYPSIGGRGGEVICKTLKLHDYEAWHGTRISRSYLTWRAADEASDLYDADCERADRPLPRGADDVHAPRASGGGARAPQASPERAARRSGRRGRVR